MSVSAAIVGTGFMAWVHAEALNRVGVPIAGVLGSSVEKSVAAARQLRAGRAYRDFDELLGDDDVSVLHVVTPNRHHFEMCQRAIAAGKHVLCEKPLAMTSEESAALVKLAEENPQLALGVNYNVRFYPLCIEAKQRVLDGHVGRVLHVNGSYLQDWLLHKTDYNWRVLAEEGGALRAVADIGTHWFDLVQFITGQSITAVCADLMTVHETRDRPVGEVATFQRADGVQREPVAITTEDYGSILIRFANGSRGSLTVSQVSAGRKNCLRFELSGSNQSLAWDSERANELLIGHRDQANEALIRDPALLQPGTLASTDYPGGHNEGYPDSFKQCFKAFYSAIDSGDFSEPTYPTFADGHREIVLCEAILQSHREQRWVQIVPS
ncbi:MAG: Gfo/Idh/MocA family protein [Planctomycetaceae bacterium]